MEEYSLVCFTFVNPHALTQKRRLAPAAELVIYGLVRGRISDTASRDIHSWARAIDLALTELANGEAGQLAEHVRVAETATFYYCSLCGRPLRPDFCKFCQASFSLPQEEQARLARRPVLPERVIAYAEKCGLSFSPW